MARGHLSLAFNPTTAAGRGKPSLDNVKNPCAWFVLDGKPGAFKSGMLQWFVSEPVSQSPTLAVWIVEDLLGELVDVQLTLRKFKRSDDAGGPPQADPLWQYSLSATARGIIQAGVAYPLCTSGDFFRIKDTRVGERVDALPRLTPGDYAIIGYVTGTKAPDKTLVVTYFTVAEGGGS